MAGWSRDNKMFISRKMSPRVVSVDASSPGRSMIFIACKIPVAFSVPCFTTEKPPVPRVFPIWIREERERLRVSHTDDH